MYNVFMIFTNYVGLMSGDYFAIKPLQTANSHIADTTYLMEGGFQYK